MNNSHSKLTDTERLFIEGAGELAASLSIARSVGQIYALLYIHPAPLSLEEIRRLLDISQGNASMNLRALEEWEAVERVAVPKKRAVHYQARRDLERILVSRLHHGGLKRLEAAEQLLAAAEKSMARDDRWARERLKECRAWADKSRRVLTALPQLRLLAGTILGGLGRSRTRAARG